MSRSGPTRQRRSRPRAVLQMLRRANRLMDERRYTQAYPLLRRLADGAARRDMPVRAAHLYFRAAHARLEMGGPSDALGLARRAVTLLADAGQGERLRVLLPPLIAALRAHGHYDEAVGLRAELRSLASDRRDAAPTHKADMPPHCPACGAPVHADLDASAGVPAEVECAYCGTAIRALPLEKDAG